MIWEIDFPAMGRQIYAAMLLWDPVMMLHHASGVRMELQLTRSAHAASYAADQVDVFIAGEFLAREIVPPGWWDRTLAEAQAELHLPPYLQRPSAGALASSSGVLANGAST